MVLKPPLAQLRTVMVNQRQVVVEITVEWGFQQPLVMVAILTMPQIEAEVVVDYLEMDNKEAT